MSRLSSIDEYLDLLADSLQTSPRRTRRILAETEDHLRSASRALIERGIDPEAAEDEAIAGLAQSRRWHTASIVRTN